MSNVDYTVGRVLTAMLPWLKRIAEDLRRIADSLEKEKTDE